MTAMYWRPELGAKRTEPGLVFRDRERPMGGKKLDMAQLRLHRTKMGVLAAMSSFR
jgi:hypothetical protein